MPIVEIFKLKPHHLKRLTDFFKSINTPEYIRDFSPHPFDEESARCICNYKGRDMYYAIVLDDEIAGYGMLRGWDEGYEIPAIGLCISKKYHRSGLGKLLLGFLETAAGLNGCSKVMLKVKKDNEAARNLYDRNGYVFKEYNQDFLIGYKDLKGERK